MLAISFDLAEIADKLGNQHEARKHYTRVARFGPAALGFNQEQVLTARAWLGPNAPSPADPDKPRPDAPILREPSDEVLPVEGHPYSQVPPPVPIKPLAGGISADRVDPDAGIPLSEDQLSLGVYASMLATAVAHHDTPMPLSIGLFGKWGSGKSFMMGLLRAEIDRLAASRDDAYLSDIVQIGFNAWHYSDSNLWASLGDEIFRQLAGSGEDAEARGTRLAAELAEVMEHRKHLESQTEQAKTETARLKQRLDEVSATQNATAMDLLKALSRSDSIRSRLGALWRRLGVTDHAEQAKLFSDEMRGAVTELSAMRGLLRSRLGRLSTVAVVLAMSLFAAAALVPPDWKTWLGTTWRAWAASAGVVTI